MPRRKGRRGWRLCTPRLGAGQAPACAVSVVQMCESFFQPRRRRSVPFDASDAAYAGLRSELLPLVDRVPRSGHGLSDVLVAAPPNEATVAAAACTVIQRTLSRMQGLLLCGQQGGHAGMPGAAGGCCGGRRGPLLGWGRGSLTM